MAGNCAQQGETEEQEEELSVADTRLETCPQCQAGTTVTPIVST